MGFTAEYNGKKFSGIVYNDCEETSQILLCNNNGIGDYGYDEMLGFDKCVAIDDYDESDPNTLNDNYSISNLIFTEIPKGFKAPIKIDCDGDDVIFKKGEIEVGCKTISNEIVRKIAANLKD